MRRPLAKNLLVPVFLLVLTVASAAAQDRKVVTEVDPGIGVAFDLTEKVRLDFFAGKEKSEEIHSSKGKFSVGASFRVKPLFKQLLDEFDTDKQHVLVVGVAYEYSHASEAGVTTNENKLMLDATARWAFANKLLVNNRNRFEFRWINGDNHFRYRNRFLAERTFNVKKIKLTPYGAAEAIWDRRYDKWSTFRFTGGVQIPFIRRSSWDLFYERVHCVTCADPHTNVFGVTLNFYLRRKK